MLLWLHERQGDGATIRRRRGGARRAGTGGLYVRRVTTACRDAARIVSCVSPPCCAGGLRLGNDQWIYLAFVINWYAAEAGDPQTVARFFGAINQSLTRLKEWLERG
jgi:hypothetical protein